MEEERLPVVSSSLGENNKHKILMNSPWEILQTPVGSGGVISLLSSHNILESLTTIGVEYIEVNTSYELLFKWFQPPKSVYSNKLNIILIV